MDQLGAIARMGKRLQRLAGCLSSARAAWRRRQKEVALLRELERLDAHILKDIGFRREELLVAREDEEPRKTGEAGARKARPTARCRCRYCGALLRGCSA